MAARLNTRQSDNSKAAIQTTQLVKRLQKHALNTDREDTLIVMDKSQIDAAKYLIGLNLPSIKALDVTAEISGKLIVETEVIDFTGKG